MAAFSRRVSLSIIAEESLSSWTGPLYVAEESEGGWRPLASVFPSLGEECGGGGRVRLRQAGEELSGVHARLLAGSLDVALVRRDLRRRQRHRLRKSKEEERSRKQQGEGSHR